MALYTFYPCKDDGASDTFICRELADDAQAYVQALDILDQHPSASHVVAWCGERKAVTRVRMDERLRSVLARSAPAPAMAPDQHF